MNSRAAGMDIYWYCPFPYPHIPPLARTVMRPGDRLLAHLPATGLEDLVETRPPGYRVLAELPDVPALREGSASWLFSRGVTYSRRARLRHRRVGAHRFDICHIHFLNYFTDGWSLAALGRSGSLVSNVHDVLPHQRRIPGVAERSLLKAVYRNAGTIVVAHPWVRRRLLDEFDLRPERVEVIPLPIPSVPSAPPQPKGGEPFVLFFGTLRRNKGLDVLLDAVRILRGSSAGDIRVRIAGRGSKDVEELVHRAAASDPGIEAEVGFIRESRKDELFRAASLVVLPYTSFTSQSGVLGDAYAYRVPVVVTDVGALGETVRDDGTGWVVPPGSAGALAAVLVQALSDQGARKQAGQAAGRAASDRSYEAVGCALRELYERIGG